MLHKLYWDLSAKNCSGFSQNHHLRSTELLSRPPYRHAELIQPLNNALRTERKSCEPLTTYWRSQAPWAPELTRAGAAWDFSPCSGDCRPFLLASSVSWPTDYVFSQPSDPRPAPSQTSSGNKALRLSRPDSAAHLVACSHPFQASQVTTGLHMCSGASPDLEFGSGVRFHSKSISKIKQNKNSCVSKDLNQESRKIICRLGGNIWKS